MNLNSTLLFSKKKYNKNNILPLNISAWTPLKVKLKSKNTASGSRLTSKTDFRNAFPEPEDTLVLEPPDWYLDLTAKNTKNMRN